MAVTNRPPFFSNACATATHPSRAFSTPVLGVDIAKSMLSKFICGYWRARSSCLTTSYLTPSLSKTFLVSVSSFVHSRASEIWPVWKKSFLPHSASRAFQRSKASSTQRV